MSKKQILSCEESFFIEHANVVHKEGVAYFQGIPRFLGRLMVLVSIALDLGGDENELGTMRDIIGNVSILYAVHVKGIAGLVPQKAKPVSIP